MRTALLLRNEVGYYALYLVGHASLAAWAGFHPSRLTFQCWRADKHLNQSINNSVNLGYVTLGLLIFKLIK